MEGAYIPSPHRRHGGSRTPGFAALEKAERGWKAPMGILGFRLPFLHQPDA